jgi:hypothetical protein
MLATDPGSIAQLSSRGHVLEQGIARFLPSRKHRVPAEPPTSSTHRVLVRNVIAAVSQPVLRTTAFQVAKRAF